MSTDSIDGIASSMWMQTKLIHILYAKQGQPWDILLKYPKYPILKSGGQMNEWGAGVKILTNYGSYIALTDV